MAKKGKKLHELPEMSEISYDDLLLMEDVSEPDPLRTMKYGTMITAVGGYPPIEKIPEGAVDIPDWRVEGIEGAWLIYIDTIIKDATYYVLYYWEAAEDGFMAIDSVAEIRKKDSERPLVIKVTAFDRDPPRAAHRRFKIRTITPDYKSALSNEKWAWTKLKLPANWTPAKPSFDDDGYPYITYLPQKGPGYEYEIRLRAITASGEKEYIKQYIFYRATDSGSGSFDGTEPYVDIRQYDVKHYDAEGNHIPVQPKIPFRDIKGFKVGWKYRYQVVAIALNGNKSQPSDYQEITLTADTTAPDPPTFTVTTFPTHFEVKFHNPYDATKPPPTQNEGDPCPDWRYYLICHKKEGESGDPEPPCEGTGFKHYDMVENWQDPFTIGVSAEDVDKTFIFKAKSVDYSGNSSEWSPPSDPDKIKKVTGDYIPDRELDETKIVLKCLTDAEIADIGITKIQDDCITTPMLKAGAVKAGNIAAQAVNLSKLNFIPLTSKGQADEIILTINATSEGARIGGGKLHIESDTTFDSDVVIQGILTSGGGLKTSSGANRIELGNFLGVTDRLSVYYSDVMRIAMMNFLLNFFDSGGTSKLQLSSERIFAKEGVYIYTKSYMKADSYIKTGAHFKVGDNQVVGARFTSGYGNADYATANPTQWSECVHKNDMNAFVINYNRLLYALGINWHGLTNDTGA